jgi:GxxExxY protein
MKLLYKEECYEIVGACMEVHNELGSGFLENVYMDALEVELERRNIEFQREKKYEINYKGTKLKHCYRADLLAYNEIILEIKAVKELSDIHMAQTINYLKASGKKLGLLINFSQESLTYRRVVNDLKDSGFK